MAHYYPTIPESAHDQRQKLTEGYDAFSLADLRRLVQRLVENGVSCALWRATLEHHPRALQPVLQTLLDRPPFTSFDAYLTRCSLGRETSFAHILGRGATPEHLKLDVCSADFSGVERLEQACFSGVERLEQVHRAVDHVRRRLQQEDRNPLFGSPDRPVLTVPGEGRVVERSGSVPVVPLATFVLPTSRLTLELAFELEVPKRHGVGTWGGHTIPDILHSATFWGGQHFEPTIRIGMFGLAEVDTLDPEAIAVALPAGAQPAGLVELLYAIELYPRLLSWVRFDPEGGFRSRRADFWLCGMRMEPSRDRIPACYVDVDPLLETPTLRWGTARDPHLDRGEKALVPYVIPLEPIDPKSLNLECPRF